MTNPDRPRNSKSFKRKVRARMAETGQNYTSAMRDLQAERDALRSSPEADMLRGSPEVDVQPLPLSQPAGSLHVTFQPPDHPLQ